MNEHGFMFIMNEHRYMFMFILLYQQCTYAYSMYVYCFMTIKGNQCP